jgi:CotS family spore coat protein
MLAMAPPYLRAGEEALDLLRRSEYQSLAVCAARDRSFCQHDPAGHNFIAGPDGLRILDFDYLICDTPLHDLGSLVGRGLKARGWEPRVARVVIDSYAGGQPLPEGWQGVLLAFLRWPQAFWRVVHQYYVEELTWTEERFLNRLLGRAGELEAKMACLRMLADGEALKTE